MMVCMYSRITDPDYLVHSVISVWCCVFLDLACALVACSESTTPRLKLTEKMERQYFLISVIFSALNACVRKA